MAGHVRWPAVISTPAGDFQSSWYHCEKKVETVLKLRFWLPVVNVQGKNIAKPSKWLSEKQSYYHKTIRRKTTNEITKSITRKAARNTTEEKMKNYHQPSEINCQINNPKPSTESSREIDYHQRSNLHTIHALF